MVDTTTAADAAVTAIRDRLATAGTRSILTVDHVGRCARINLAALAALIAEIVTEHTTALRAERDLIARESDMREQEIVALTVERDRAEAVAQELSGSGCEGVA